MKNLENNSIRILVIDDVSQNIQVIGSILMEQQYDVSFATSGKEALEMLTYTEFDLVLLDILMPGMDGFEVCRNIRSRWSSREMPIIFLTARTDMDSVLKGFELGAQDYLTKPFKTEELLARVKTQIELKKQNEQLARMNEKLEEKVQERTYELKQAYQQLGILEKAKNNFLGLISHELRTPLNILNGFTEILQESLRDKEHLESLEYIRTSAQKLINLSETALLITEIQLGKYNLDLETVSLHEIISEAIQRHEAWIRAKKIQVINKILNRMFIPGDRPLLLNSVERILENAIEATPENGRINIAAKEHNGKVRLRIHDSGPGFSDKDLSRTFEIFDKDLSAENYGGFGLGLPAVKLVMDVHSGVLELENDPAGGAAVSLVFNRKSNP
ncbi:MAG: response regulator [Bacteroidales bacterium]